MLNTIEQKQDYIKSLQEKATPHEIRRIIRKTFDVKKTRGNQIYNEIFGVSRQMKFNIPIASDEMTERMVKISEFPDKLEAKVTVEKAMKLEDVIKLCQIDTGKYSVKSFRVEEKAKGNFSWSVSMGINKEGQQIDAYKEVIDELLVELKDNAPLVKKIHDKSVDNNDLMLEIGLVDAHVGRLAWSPADGDDYDLKIAEKLIYEAISDIMVKAKRHGKFSKICLWIGGDYLNVDNESNSTTLLTPQSVDSRFPKVFKKGKDILISIINELKETAPIDVIISGGNHDHSSLFHMGEVLESRFFNDKNVHIDNGPQPRKYYKYGQNLIQFSHGDKVSIKKLPAIAASECKDWSLCKFREIHSGHFHHEELMVSETAGCKTRILNTIAGVDDYHSTHGYVGNLRCFQSFVWHKESGLQSIIYSNPVV